jgi:2-deoxy-D-gluconate 3-dehydrogenase
MRLLNKVALITGAAQGLGAEIARRFHKEGAVVFICDINESDGRKTAGGMNGSVFLKLDVTSEESWKSAIGAVMSKSGRLDILINNAGINIPQWAVDVTEEAWDHVIDLNLKGLFFCCQAVGKVMIRQQKGKIINVSSTMGSVGMTRRSAYSSSKAGVNLLTKVLAIEWAPHHINVNAIAPTFVETPLTKPMFEEPGFRDFVLGNIPMGRILKPTDLFGAILYLASEASDMVTGHVLLIDGGWTAH